MKCLSIQLQSQKCKLPEISHLVDTLVANAQSHPETANVSVTTGDDSGPYTNINVQTNQVAELWACIGSLVINDEVLSSCVIVCCEGDNGWDDYQLLYHFDKSVALMPYQETSVNYRIWMLRIIGWDGFLPVLVTSLSVAVASLFGNNRLIAESLMVLLPIVALFIRFSIGSKQIRSNYCGAIFRGLQLGSLGLAVLIFLLADFLVVLSAFIPKNQRHAPPEDIPIYIAALAIYLVLVTTAMYPGREPASV